MLLVAVSVPEQDTRVKVNSLLDGLMQNNAWSFRYSYRLFTGIYDRTRRKNGNKWNSRQHWYKSNSGKEWWYYIRLSNKRPQESSLMNTKHQEIEINFSELMNLLRVWFTSSGLDEVFEFIKYNEYGLALDTIIDIIIEENKNINYDTFYLIMKLSDIMELDSDNLGKKLMVHVLWLCAGKELPISPALFLRVVGLTASAYKGFILIRWPLLRLHTRKIGLAPLLWEITAFPDSGLIPS